MKLQFANMKFIDYFCEKLIIYGATCISKNVYSNIYPIGYQ